jgi:hypothetical protein
MIGSFPDKRFDRFGPSYYPPHQKQKMKKNDIPAPVEASKMCPMEVYYDGDIHDAVANGAANLRKLDGIIPVHPQYDGVPVNFFAPKGSRKYWTKASTPELRYFIHFFCIISILVIILIIDIIEEQIFPVPRSG